MQVYELITCVQGANENAGNLISVVQFLINIYILLTKREGRTGRISARGLDSTDLAALGPYKKD